MSLDTQIAALEAAIERGVTSVRDENGREVTYPSLDAVRRTLGGLKAQQRAGASGAGVHLTPLAHGDGK